jgi:hypothetical protein
VRIGPRVKHAKGPQGVSEGEALGYRAKEEVDAVLEGLPLGGLTWVPDRRQEREGAAVPRLGRQPRPTVR